MPSAPADVAAAAAVGGSGLLRLLSKASWNLVDQVLSAGTNFALSLVVARAVDARAFGAFAVAFLVFTVAVGVERALVGQPMSIRFSSAHEGNVDEALSAGAATVLAVSVVGGAGAALVGVLLGGVLGPTLIAVGLCLPGLALQDACRMFYFARAKAKQAALNDALWGVLQFGSIGLLLLAGRDEVWVLISAWGASALVCSILALSRLGVRPKLSGVPQWVHQQRDLAGYLLAEYLLGAGAVQGGVLGVGALVGVGDVGALRAAQVLLGPLGVIASAAFTFLLPEISKRSQLPAATRLRVAVAVSAVMVGLSVVYLGPLVLLPDAWGTTLLGDTWVGARSVLLPIGLASVASAAGLGPAIVIYAMGMARVTFKLHLVQAPLFVVCIVGGGLLGSTEGVGWGMALVQLIMIPLWFTQTVHLLTRSERRG